MSEEVVTTINEESIFDSIKEMVLGNAEDDSFDIIIKMLINSAISTLTQVGVGPVEGFSIEGSNETWADFIGNDPKSKPWVKNYVYAKVRLGFDTPASSIVSDVLQKMIAECEWRLNIECDKSF